MLKLIIGLKGTGKTKDLIERVNTATAASDGSVVCIAKGNKLIHEITSRARLVDTEEYGVDSAASLYGMVAGMYASNHDITHVYIDSALKIFKDDLADFEEFLTMLNALGEKNNLEIVATCSIAKEDLPAYAEKYL